jgi:hypothetical protein
MHKAFSRIYHLLGHQTSLNKHEEVEIYQLSYLITCTKTAYMGRREMRSHKCGDISMLFYHLWVKSHRTVEIILRKVKFQTQHMERYGMQEKQYAEENSWWHVSTTKEKYISNQQSNILPKKMNKTSE